MREAAMRRVGRSLVVVDPGLVRLRSAAATTASLILGLVVMLGVTRVTGEAVSVAMLGGVVAMQASAAVKDRDQRARVITTVLLAAPAIGAATLAAALSPHGVIADVGFIAVLFAAVWVRRYGPRGNALGMVAFIAYFFSLFLHATLEQIPALAVAVVVGVAASLVVHLVVFPERPRAEARRLLSALRMVSGTVLDTALDPSLARDDDGIDVLRQRLARLGETALLIDDWLDRHEAAESLSVTSRDLALQVFEAQIMLEQLAGLLWVLERDQPRPADLDGVLAALRSCLVNGPSDDDLRAARCTATVVLERADLTTVEGLATVAAARSVQAHLAIHHITTNALGAPEDDTAESEDAVEDDAQDEDASTGLHASTKAAIQVTIATSAATVLGELVSPNRWYWAVLTAFLVFTGVTTRGEILSRAGYRIVGTIAGVVAGVVLAALIGQRPPLQIAVLLVCVFVAFYVAVVSYVWLTFFMTVLLAMLYGLLGTFSLQVLEVRIAETAVGALVGIASAYFVFSTKTRATFAEKVSDYLDQLDAVIDTAVDAVVHARADTELVADTRKLDVALQAALTAGKPLQLGPIADTRRGVRRLLRGLQVGNRSAHALARAGVAASRTDAAAAPPDATAETVRQAADCAKAMVDGIRRMMAGEVTDPGDEPAGSVVLDFVGGPGIPPGPVRAAVRALNHVERTFVEISARV
nr:FUSC family protein [Mycolicibacterium grossiae]